MKTETSLVVEIVVLIANIFNLIAGIWMGGVEHHWAEGAYFLVIAVIGEMWIQSRERGQR